MFVHNLFHINSFISRRNRSNHLEGHCLAKKHTALVKPLEIKVFSTVEHVFFMKKLPKTNTKKIKHSLASFKLYVQQKIEQAR